MTPQKKIIAEKSGAHLSKVLLDPIQGRIELSSDEVRILDSTTFRRLRNIKQLGIANEVFPGATHSRFSHSIGAVHVASRMADALSISTDDKLLLRIAMLLHDVGRFPLSRELETWDNAKWTESALTRSELADVIQSAGFEPREVIEVIQGKYRNRTISEIVKGDLDADRIDYLARDSYYSGLSQGFDFARVIRSMATDESSGRIVIKEKALDEVLSLLTTMNVVYNQLYFNKSIRILELLIDRILTLLISAGAVVLPDTLENFGYFDDVYLWSQLREVRSNREGTDITRKLIDWLFNRELPQLVWAQTVSAFDSFHEFSVNRWNKSLANLLNVDESLLFTERLKFPTLAGLLIRNDDERTITLLSEKTGLVRLFGSVLARVYLPRDVAHRATGQLATEIQKLAEG